MMRYIYICLSAIVMALIWSAGAEATKLTAPGASCANVRCGSGNCVDTPAGPICQPQQVTCANVLCVQGNQCVETSTGPQCVPATNPTYPTYPSYPSYPVYPPQSCAYGGYYQYGQLICNPAPAWRHPYQNGWDHYQQPPYYYYQPRPVPRPQPRPRPRPPWYPDGGERIDPQPRMCTMEYAPVCAERPVVCVRAPCPADRRTFSNSCMAQNDGYTVLYRGQCH